MEERIYQGYVYRRAGPNEPWQQVGPAQSGGGRGRVIADPYRPKEEARKERDQQLQEQGVQIQRDNVARSSASDAETSARTRANDAIDNPQKLRKEYADLPEVREYKIAAQMASAGLGTASSPQGDIALTYSFAKAMDPASVVRDQEADMVTNSQPWIQSAVEGIKKQFGMDGAGNFTPEARARIRLEIVKALASRKPLYEQRRAEMAEVAKANGIEPNQVIGKNDTEAFAPEFRKYAEANGDEDGVFSRLIGGDPIKVPQVTQKAAGFAATDTSVPIPPEMQRAHAEYLAQNWGRIDPQDYAAFRINLDKQYGFGSDPKGYAASVEPFNKFAAQGGTAAAASGIPAVKKELSGFDQFRNNVVSNPLGAGVASALNAGGFGIPSLFAPEEFQALREEYPVESFVGELGGGVGGTGLAGGILRTATRGGESAVARALATPLAADIGYGAAYGATQAEDPLYGALTGGAAGFAGNRVGGAIGRAFPGITGTGRAIRAADQTVPSSEEVRSLAAEAYARAEATGQRATGEETLALADTTGGLLSGEGRLTPADRLTEVQPKVAEAYRLIGDYAGQEMAPKQFQAVRSVLADGLDSQDDKERRIARLLLDNFDEWSDNTVPDLASGLREGRKISSRYLQGDKIARAREGADIRTSQLTNSGAGNAVRTDFRALDRGIKDGKEMFAPQVEDAIREASRGTPISNSLRNVGKFGFQHPLNAGVAIAGGGATAGPIGGGVGAALATLGTGAQMLSNRLSSRAGQVAENLAFGGEEYGDVLSALLTQAQARGGHGGAVLTTDLARLLSEQAGY